MLIELVVNVVNDLVTCKGDRCIMKISNGDICYVLDVDTLISGGVDNDKYKVL